MHFDLKREGRERLRSNIAAETLQPSSLSFVLVRTGEQQEEQHNNDFFDFAFSFAIESWFQILNRFLCRKSVPS